jgi:hypothetical protein
MLQSSPNRRDLLGQRERVQIAEGNGCFYLFDEVVGEVVGELEQKFRIRRRRNSCVTNDPCAICGARCDPTGFDPFLKNTWRLVCEQCAHDESATEY